MAVMSAVMVSQAYSRVKTCTFCICTVYCCCSVTQSCLTLCDPMDCSTPGLPVPHHLLKYSLVHVHCISDAIQLSPHLMPSSPSALSLCQHQGLF